MKMRLHSTGPSRQSGFSLIELMISMVIGMVVVGAVLAAYLGAGNSSRTSRAMAQITEDASIAMNVMRSSISMVGYGKPTGVDKFGKFQKAYTGLGVFGCDTPFTAPDADIGTLACGKTGTTPDAIAIAYEADKDNSVVDKKGVPLDCLGSALELVGGTYYEAYNRFYVKDGQLMCMGNPKNPAQPLVDNVADLQIRYGVANAAAPNQIARYETASSLQTELNTTGWNQVISVRICVVIKSAENVLDKPLTYQGCNGQVDGADGDLHLYRTFTTTIVMQNRMGI